MRVFPSFTGAVALALCLTAQAQSTVDAPDPGRWGARSGLTTVPAPRGLHGMVFDTARSRMVLHGGRGTAGLLGDTWEYDGAAWTRVNLATTANPTPASPGPRVQFGFAYDTARARAVLFGGSTGVALLNDTWEWNGSAWTQRTGLFPSPSARTGAAMAYDPVRARVVLFGGFGASGAMLGDTWEFDGDAWQLISPAGPRPSPRAWSALTFDPSRNAVVLHAGYTFDAAPPNDLLSDTWAWNGSAWAAISTLSGMPRSNHTLVFDPSAPTSADGSTPPGALVAFGGYTPMPEASRSDTQHLINGQWRTASTSLPSKRSNTALVHDAPRARLVLFGGIDDVSPPVYYSDTVERLRFVRAPGAAVDARPALLPQGNAVITAAPGPVFTLTRLAVASQDGAQIDMAANAANAGALGLSLATSTDPAALPTLPITQPPAFPAGATLTLAAQSAESAVATLTVRHPATGAPAATPIRIDAEFPTLQITRVRVQPIVNGLITQTVPSAGLTTGPAAPAQVQAASPPIALRYIRFRTTAAFALRFAQPTAIVIGTGSTAVNATVDELRIVGVAANTPITPPAPTGLLLRAAGLPAALHLAEITVTPPAACPAAIVSIGNLPPADGLVTGDDFNTFFAAFAAGDPLADITGIGGPPALPDGLITGDDFNAFISAFAAGCP
jgi:hypothetical protein